MLKFSKSSKKAVVEAAPVVKKKKPVAAPVVEAPVVKKKKPVAAPVVEAPVVKKKKPVAAPAVEAPAVKKKKKAAPVVERKTREFPVVEVPEDFDPKAKIPFDSLVKTYIDEHRGETDGTLTQAKFVRELKSFVNYLITEVAPHGNFTICGLYFKRYLINRVYPNPKGEGKFRVTNRLSLRMAKHIAPGQCDAFDPDAVAVKKKKKK